ncbi:hypothetical protein TVAG_240040 [Trichomonas vaginalis G3]|uniref:protein-serine/threonine phosphatase n=1 Tax=Trichomonas vaginalis (strain ATCC PRA-98 / G3) TaxID=412133 RepID=A2EFE6_TRIV3|nr:phosphoprotein phosphatase protein [Trichomonas vaginalis G3]EAY08643.1 hypothetical protein TVAG_240040 [Trichomonas vaginalis G3]KAI5543846.1 phosphoprotein phosphatase protein [Trichomonas vaginalis G3]|eukprot:XP_001320866.1 hypothetical protein [Trichomonas vaginalis G3]
MLRRPILTATDIVEGIVWSDPKPEQKIEYLNSPRGHGYYFNQTALESFLEKNKLKGLIRGHLFVDGYESMFDGKCITVFSASNYTTAFSSSSAILMITATGEISSAVYPGLDTPSRMQPVKQNPFPKLNMATVNVNSTIIPRMTNLKRTTKVRNENTARPRHGSEVQATSIMKTRQLLLGK